MGIESKVKSLFNEISCGLLYLIKPIYQGKRDYTNDLMKPLTNDLMKPLTNNLMKPILPIGKKDGLLIDEDYPRRYCSPHDKSEFSYAFLLEKEKPPIDMRDYDYPLGYFSSHDKSEIRGCD